MAEVVFALPELDLLVVFRVFMVSSSLINYKVPEFYRCISIGNTSTTRSIQLQLPDFPRVLCQCWIASV
jgi:hypothetical protein